MWRKVAENFAPVSLFCSRLRPDSACEHISRPFRAGAKECGGKRCSERLRAPTSTKLGREGPGAKRTRTITGPAIRRHTDTPKGMCRRRSQKYVRDKRRHVATCPRVSADQYYYAIKAPGYRSDVISRFSRASVKGRLLSGRKCVPFLQDISLTKRFSLFLGYLGSVVSENQPSG